MRCSSSFFLPQISQFWLVTVLYILSSMVYVTDTVLCYCTNCKYGYCEGQWCLMGFRDTRTQIHRECSSGPAGSAYKECLVDTGQWQEICSCQKYDYCNTYLNFRLAINSAFKKLDHTYVPVRDIVNSGQYGSRSGYPPDPYSPGSGENGSGLPGILNQGQPFTNSHLIILLVCVPLGIGAFTAVIVFVNYHCKLC